MEIYEHDIKLSNDSNVPVDGHLFFAVYEKSFSFYWNIIHFYV